MDDFRSCHATAIHGAFSLFLSLENEKREERNLFLEAAQVGPYLLCLLNTPRFARRTQYPLLWIHSIILLCLLFVALSLSLLCLSLSLAQVGSAALKRAYTHTYAPSCRMSFSLFLPPFHSSSVVSVSRATLRRPLARPPLFTSSFSRHSTTEILRRLIAAISSAPRIPSSCHEFGFLRRGLHCHEFMGRAV